MDIKPLHRWDLKEADAIALQRELAGRIDTSPPLGGFQLVAGADVSNNRFSNTVYAGVLVLRRDDWGVVEQRGAVGEALMPYIPGLLSFREAPVLLEAFAKLQTRPDVVVLDGQGIAHPRGLGIAAHVGLWLDVPCVGCAKSKLWGTYGDLDSAAGSSVPLTYKGAVVGQVLRSKKGTNPLFVSPGNRIDLASSVRVVQACLRGYRLPEPTRRAHDCVNAIRRGELPC